jgi:hypothetical protein
MYLRVVIIFSVIYFIWISTDAHSIEVDWHSSVKIAYFGRYYHFYVVP